MIKADLHMHSTYSDSSDSIPLLVAKAIEKGLDAIAKQELGVILDALREEGRTLIIVSHDLSFVAAHTDTCSLLADGDIIAADTTREFFAGNTFYTTPVGRMTRGIINDCVTVEDIVFRLRQEGDVS